MSFVELFNDLAKYQPNEKKRYLTCVRMKRGMTNTAEKGGLYKDQVYL